MSTTRIRLSDGRYCYSGPNCKWHSPAGVNKARKELAGATEQIIQAQSYAELEAARTRLEAARKQYDATTEGVEELKKLAGEASDPLEKAALHVRLEKAKEALSNAEAEAERLWQQEGAEELSTYKTFLNAEHSYTEPTLNSSDSNTSNTSSAYIGSNYDSNLSNTQTAAAVRKELKKAVEANYLPADVEYKVLKTGSGRGEGYRISIRGLSDADTYPNNGWTPAARELKRRTDLIAKSFTYDASFPQADYYQRSMAIYSVIETDEDRVSREREEARTAERKRLAPLVKQLKEDRRYLPSMSFSEGSTLADGFRYSKVNNEDTIIAVENGDRISYYDLRDRQKYNSALRRYDNIHSQLEDVKLSDIRKYRIK